MLHEPRRCVVRYRYFAVIMFHRTLLLLLAYSLSCIVKFVGSCYIARRFVFSVTSFQNATYSIPFWLVLLCHLFMFYIHGLRAYLWINKTTVCREMATDITHRTTGDLLTFDTHPANETHTFIYLCTLSCVASAYNVTGTAPKEKTWVHASFVAYSLSQLQTVTIFLCSMLQLHFEHWLEWVMLA